ncbi:unnamed protein product [Symbiodinium sp. CCMP2456]|nr:unnamed protein product [Symbiodinium sp. CCMP2456]
MPGDTAHPIEVDAVEAALPRLDTLLQDDNRRDGPRYPVDPAELLRRRVCLQDNEESPFVNMLFLVLTPGRIPEAYNLPLQTPCSVEAALLALEQSRDEAPGVNFPEIRVAEPQPAREYAVFVAAPSWAIDRTIIVCDARKVNGALFCAVAPPRANRETICNLAGFQHDYTLQVYVQGMPWALAAWQQADLKVGDTVTFLPPGQPAPRQVMIEEMLFSAEHWNAQADVPSPPGEHFHVLTDGIPARLTLERGQRGRYREALAEQLQYREQNMTLQSAKRQLPDIEVSGFHVKGVAVATEAISRLPVPPARPQQRKWIVIFDLRNILLPFSWKLLEVPTISVQDIIDAYESLRPVGYIVAVTGAPIENLPDGPVFRIVSGQVLVVTFEPDYLEEDDDPGHGNFHDTTFLDAAQGSPATGHTSEEYQVSAATSEESNARIDGDVDLPDSAGVAISPAETIEIACTILIPGFSAEHFGLTIALPAATAQVIDKINDVRDEITAWDFPRLVPIAPQLAEGRLLLIASTEWPPFGNTVCVRVYSDITRIFAMPAPSSASKDILLEMARLSLHAPLDVFCDGQGPIAPDEVVDIRDGSAHLHILGDYGTASLQNGQQYSMEGTPQMGGYALRVIRAQMMQRAPQRNQALLMLAVFEVAAHTSLDELVINIREGRDKEASRIFPFLAPATPQPPDEGAVFIALPRWTAPAPIVLFDARRYDGRLFVVHATDLIDLSAALFLAGIPYVDDALVYDLSGQQFLQDGQDIRTAMFWALAWLLQKNLHVPAHLWGDCIAALGQIQPALYNHIKAHTGALALPLVELEDGNIAQDVGQADQRWLRHFSSIEDGAPVTVDSHIQSCVNRQIATHAVRSFQQACVRRKQSCAVLFVDLREAFHRVVRPLIHGGPLSDHHVAGIVKELGLGPDAIPRLHAYVRAQSLLVDAGASQWTSRVMQEIGEDAWFTFGSTGAFAHVRGGTRPGDNLADLVFTFLFAEISKRIREHLSRAGVSAELPWNPSWLCNAEARPTEATATSCPVDVTWMDDLSVLLHASTPHALIERLKIAATATLDECIQAVLLPNLRAGKTEAVVTLVGHGALRLSKTVFAGAEPSLPLGSILWPEARLRLAASYKHLGGILQVDGSLKKEVKARIGSAWQAFNKHKKLIFGSPIVTAHEKSVLFASLIESTLYYGSGTWAVIGKDEHSRLQNCLVQMSRHMLRPLFSFDQACHLSPAYVLSTARVSSAATALHVERLRHLKAVILKATPELWAILQYERTWLGLLDESLVWFRAQHHSAGSCHPTWTTWVGIVDFVRSNPNGWKRAVNKAKRTAMLSELWSAEMQQFQGLAFRAFITLGAVVPRDLVELEHGREVCGKCRLVFDSLCSWSHHAFKRHGRIKPARRLVSGTQCPVCLKQYRSNRDLCNHVTYGRACRHALINAGFDEAPAPGVGNRKYDDGTRCLLPVVQAQGPGSQWDYSPVVEEHETPCDTILNALEDCYCHDEGSVRNLQHLWASFRSIFMSQCLQTSRLRATAIQWQFQVCNEIEADNNVSAQWADWHLQVAKQLVDTDFVEWFSSDCDGPTQTPSTFRDAETLTAWLEFPAQAVVPVAAPNIPGVCYVPDDAVYNWISRPFRASISHRTAQQSPEKLDFEQVARSLGELEFVLLSCEGLVHTFGPPVPLRSFSSISGPISSLRLFSDLLRGALYLWRGGTPACLILPEISSPTTEVVRKLAPSAKTVGGVAVFANFAFGQGDFRFTFS